MKLLKWMIIIFSIMVIVFIPIGLFTNNFVVKLIGAISLLINSILSIIRLIIQQKNKKKSSKDKS